MTKVKSEDPTEYSVNATLDSFEPEAIINKAKELVCAHFERVDDILISSPREVRDYLTLELAPLEYESFFVMYLDSKHQLIKSEHLFRGTIDNASVPTREVAKEALANNAAALIVAHNHPSGITDPSMPDRVLTENLYASLALVGVKLLDSFVVGDNKVVSLAEMGVL